MWLIKKFNIESASHICLRVFCEMWLIKKYNIESARHIIQWVFCAHHMTYSGTTVGNASWLHTLAWQCGGVNPLWPIQTTSTNFATEFKQYFRLMGMTWNSYHDADFSNRSILIRCLSSCWSGIAVSKWRCSYPRVFSCWSGMSKAAVFTAWCMKNEQAN